MTNENNYWDGSVSNKTNKELQAIAWPFAHKQYSLYEFKVEVQKLQKTYPQIKVSYAEEEVDPTCSCAVKDCPHFTILDVFEKKPMNYWDEKNAKAIKHPYWIRRHGYAADNPAALPYRQTVYDRAKRGLYGRLTIEKSNNIVRMKIKGYYELYQHIKKHGYINDPHRDPAFLVNLDIFSEFTSSIRKKRGASVDETIYMRHDGHHRADIMRYLGKRLPVIIAKFDF